MSWTCAITGTGSCPAESGTGDINTTVDLNAGSSAKFTASAAVSATVAGTISNSASVATPSIVADPDTDNNSDTQTTNRIPVAGADLYAAIEDATLVVEASGVLTNNSDPDGSSLNTVLVSTPSHGTLTLNSNGSFSYVPHGNFSGTDSFSYKASDGSAASAPATVTIDIAAGNDEPTATTQQVTTDEDVAVLITLSGSSLDGDPLTFKLTSLPAKGALYKGDSIDPADRINSASLVTPVTLSNATVTYRPNLNYNNSPFNRDVFRFVVSDGTLSSTEALVAVRVIPVDDAPTAESRTQTTNEDSLASIILAASDPDGGSLTYKITSVPSSGKLYKGNSTAPADEIIVASLSSPLSLPGNSVNYMPNAEYSNTPLTPDSFKFIVSDASTTSSEATVSVRVVPVDDAPFAVSDAYSVDEDNSLRVLEAPEGVLSNDSDIDSASLTAVLVTGPVHPMFFGLGPDGTFRYQPETDFTGIDSFTYQACDATSCSDPVTVTITVTSVEGAPGAVDDVFDVNEDNVLSVPPLGVLANDLDTQPLTATRTEGPSNGSLFLSSSGAFSYTPDANYFGTDSFAYAACDPGADNNPATTADNLCDQAVVTITINAVNDAPVAHPDSYTTSQHKSLIAAPPGVLANDNDTDGQPLTAIRAGGSGPSHGSLTLNWDGTFSYTPNTHFSGSDSFQYAACDPGADNNAATMPDNLCDEATVTIHVNAVNDAPFANDDSYVTEEDVSLNVPFTSGVRANDGDVDSTALTAHLDDGVDHGSLALYWDGGFGYTPSRNYCGTDTFNYHVSDGISNSNVATVTLTIRCLNDAPDATNDAATVAEDSISTSVDVLANDTDLESDTLSVAVVDDPMYGAVVNHGTHIAYSPDPNFNGTDVFAYQVSDRNGGLDTAQIVVTVTSVNDTPLAFDDFYGALQDTPLSESAPGVLGNDTEVDAFDSLFAELVSGPASGSLTLNLDGSFDYRPAANFSGTDSFTYRARDAWWTEGNVATVSIDVQGGTTAPIAAGDSYSTAEDVPLNVARPGILGNDTDADGDVLAVDAYGGPDHGSLTLYTDGSFSYTPNANFIGTDSFTYTARDGGLARSNVATVWIRVNGVNDAPVAVDDGVYPTNEDTHLLGASVLSNDSDVDEDVLTAVLDSGPSDAASFKLYADGTFDYTPNGNFNGFDSFDYVAYDGAAFSSEATVTIQVLSVNDAPAVTSDNASVAVHEGQTATTTGAWSDVDDDVSLTASRGTVVKNLNGTWSWSETTTDNLDATVTITANDGTSTRQSSFTVSVNNVNPSIANASFGASSSTVACGPVNATMTVTFTDPGTADTHGATIDWGDGSSETNLPFVTSGFQASHSYSAAGAYTASVKVTDDDGGTATANADTATEAYLTSGILQPVNWTQANNNPSIFKHGNTVPVKVRFTDCDGTPSSSLAVTIAVKKISGSTPATGELETIQSTSAADTGTVMRPIGDGLYLYNLATRSLSDATATYEITITVAATNLQVKTLFGTRAK